MILPFSLYLIFVFFKVNSSTLGTLPVATKQTSQSSTLVSLVYTFYNVTFKCFSETFSMLMIVQPNYKS